jgi:hypothetical protein
MHTLIHTQHERNGGMHYKNTPTTPPPFPPIPRTFRACAEEASAHHHRENYFELSRYSPAFELDDGMGAPLMAHDQSIERKQQIRSHRCANRSKHAFFLIQPSNMHCTHNKGLRWVPQTRAAVAGRGGGRYRGPGPRRPCRQHHRHQGWPYRHQLQPSEQRPMAVLQLPPSRHSAGCCGPGRRDQRRHHHHHQYRHHRRRSAHDEAEYRPRDDGHGQGEE